MSILDNAVMIGKETTYGTPVAPTDAYEAEADTYKKTVEYIDSVGMRAGQHAQRSDRAVAIPMGAEGTLELDVLNQSMGLIFEGMLGTASGPTQEAATAAYTSTFETSTAGPSTSYTVQVLRSDVAGTQTAFTHEGGVITEWELSQQLDENLKLSVSYDFEDVGTAFATGTPAYPASAVPFDWTMGAATINGNSHCITELSLTGDLGMKTDRRCIRGSWLKKQPVRAAVPSFEGSVSVEYEGNTLYDHFVDGDIIPLTFTWTGANIEGAHNYEIVVTIPAAQLRGDSPVVSLDDVPTQTIPFRVLHNGTDPAMTITIKSTDTAL